MNDLDVLCAKTQKHAIALNIFCIHPSVYEKY